MGKQYNKLIKRVRRKAYLKRKREEMMRAGGVGVADTDQWRANGKCTPSEDNACGPGLGPANVGPLSGWCVAVRALLP